MTKVKMNFSGLLWNPPQKIDGESAEKNKRLPPLTISY